MNNLWLVSWQCLGAAVKGQQSALPDTLQTRNKIMIFATKSSVSSLYFNVCISTEQRKLRKRV